MQAKGGLFFAQQEQVLTANEWPEMVVFSLCLKADQVHAAFAAVVPGVEPIPLGVGCGWVLP